MLTSEEKAAVAKARDNLKSIGPDGRFYVASVRQHMSNVSVLLDIIDRLNAPQWSSEVPTEPGWYWIFDPADGSVETWEFETWTDIEEAQDGAWPHGCRFAPLSLPSPPTETTKGIDTEEEPREQ